MFIVLQGLLAQEAYINKERDVVLHIGRRGSADARKAELRSTTLTGGVVGGCIVLLAAVTFVVTKLTIGWLYAGYGVVIVGLALLLWLAVGMLLLLKSGGDGPKLCERKIPDLHRDYWLVSTLGALETSQHALLDLVEPYLQSALPSGSLIVAVARDTRVRDTYVGVFGFLPITDKPWVLERPTDLSEAELTVRRRAAAKERKARREKVKQEKEQASPSPG
jgi:hypothetical protein